MSGNHTGEVRVFFSWQSDSPDETNTNAIRKAIGKAAKAIKNKHPALNIVPDEATRDTSGSPNIVDKITEKIDAAHVYVADITTVTPDGAKRPSANPNVLIELGYAIAQMGWDRIILLFNESIGKFPADLPFDIIQNRVSKYKIDPTVADKSSGKAGLEKLVEIAIQAVIDKNPKTPSQLRGMAPEKIQHERDVENLTWLLSQIHIPSLDEHISGLPRYIPDRILWFWEGFKGVVTNRLFHIYDPALEAPIIKLYQAWNKTLAFVGRYRDIQGGRMHVFSNPGDAPLNEEQEADWVEIERAASEMNQALQELLDRVRSAYLDVNISQTNASAWNEYRDFQKEQIEKFGA